MPIVLYAADPTKGQVSSASSLEVLAGDPAARLMIFSGIAAPNITSDGTDLEDLVRDDVIVKLGVSISAIGESVVQVGLASISNDESAFVFAIESTGLERDPATSELQLRVQAAVMGDETGLHRFSYQIVARVTKVDSQIAGNIRVPRNLLDLGNKSQSEVEATFRVTANRMEKTPRPPGAPPAFVDVKWIKVATGRLVNVAGAGDDSFVEYVVDGCPLNTDLYVEVEVSGELEGLSAVQQTGPRPVHLTSIAPAVSGVNFVVVKLPIA